MCLDAKVLGTGKKVVEDAQQRAVVIVAPQVDHHSFFGHGNRQQTVDVFQGKRCKFEISFIVEEKCGIKFAELLIPYKKFMIFPFITQMIIGNAVLIPFLQEDARDARQFDAGERRAIYMLSLYQTNGVIGTEQKVIGFAIQHRLIGSRQKFAVTLNDAVDRFVVDMGDAVAQAETGSFHFFSVFDYGDHHRAICYLE